MTDGCGDNKFGVVSCGRGGLGAFSPRNVSYFLYFFVFSGFFVFFVFFSGFFVFFLSLHFLHFLKQTFGCTALHCTVNRLSLQLI
jgi:hypothetical protein